MLQNERHERILDLVRRAGYVELSALVDSLHVSPVTIRRDLKYLEDHNLLVRTYGGAMSASHSTSHEPPLKVKRSRMTAAKRAIGCMAAQLVSPGETILLDAGSTTWEVADCLPAQHHLAVVSNDLQILLRLADVPSFEVISAGGTLRKSVYTLMGHTTEAFIRTLHVNWTFLGADAIDPRHGITNVSLEEVRVKQAMVEAAMKVAVVADHTKFGKAAFAQVCALHDVNLIITDEGLDPAMAAAVRDSGVDLRLVKVPPAEGGNLRAEPGQAGSGPAAELQT